MIERLFIKNYLIIEEAEIYFANGLNILTGETGAGKSIILDALALILGERADYSKIKKDKEKMIVEGQFKFKNDSSVKGLLQSILSDEEIDLENVILRRELLRKGSSRNFINDTPVNISDMKKLGDIIIDIHSQNEHQSLLRKETHLDILDNYSIKTETLEKYKEEFITLKDLINEYNDIAVKKDELILKKNFIDFELKELNNLNIIPKEDDDLENELNRLENIEDISTGINNALKVLFDGDNNSTGFISSAVKDLKKIEGFDGSLKGVIDDLENAYILIKESSDYLNSYRDNLDFDNMKIERIRNRLSDINHLKKKYGLSLDELLAKAEQLEKELIFADNFDFELEKLLTGISGQKKIVYESAKNIFEIRKKGAAGLEKNVNRVLREVGLEGAEFRVILSNFDGKKEDHYSFKIKNEYIRLAERGYNDIEFVVKINKGTDFSPLQKSASGGEISRIMLAIKTVLSEKDNIDILVFDEIDAGISGRIAQKVGKILKSLSKTHQIICITHLPQIAAMSTRHYRVSKNENGMETVADIKSLTEEEKITEVAKLISGESVTEASKKSALELINS